MHRAKRTEMIPSLVKDVGVQEGLKHSPSPSPWLAGYYVSITFLLENGDQTGARE